VERLPDFATIFLGIFIEAAPFLLFGTLASGIVEVFFAQDIFTRLVSRRAGLSAITGGLMGLAFPVCECGVVPLTRRLLRKGLPLPAGIAFLLAAPVLNPVVIASTFASFGWGKVLAMRMGLTLLIAVITGLVFSVEKTPWTILRPTEWVKGDDALGHTPQIQGRSLPDRWRQVLLIAMDEFFEMGRYLVIGAALAALMQVFIPQPVMLALGQGPLISVVALTGLAVLLSICSTVDAFVALGFVGTFSTGAILAFLVFGPMVDIKSVLMYGRVFRPRPVLYLILIPLLVSLLSGLLVNYYLP
jgi:uncharacterized membrane protein YraQ (UPF0718 family)